MQTAKDIMSKKVITIESEDVTATDVAKIMNKNKIGSIVVTKDEKPYGIITERDLLSKVVAKDKRPSEIKITDITTHPIMIVSSSTPVDEIAEKMIVNKIRHIVVSDGNQASGIIAITDFVKHLHSMLSEESDYKKELYDGLFEDWEYWNS
ncbi:MAG: CBS domain-containing protein [Nitrososphaera sp.]|jgi:signal-transduction protein with cAMP-binding, CBS, and nucleotidyltransferase domain